MFPTAFFPDQYFNPEYWEKPLLVTVQPCEIELRGRYTSVYNGIGTYVSKVALRGRYVSPKYSGIYVPSFTLKGEYIPTVKLKAGC